MESGVSGMKPPKQADSPGGHAAKHPQYRCGPARQTTPGTVGVQSLGRIRFAPPVAHIVLLPPNLLAALSWEAQNTSVVLLTTLTVLVAWCVARRLDARIVWTVTVLSALVVLVERFQPAYGTIFATVSTLLAAGLYTRYEYATSRLFKALQKQQIVVTRTGVAGERESLQAWVYWVGQAMWGLPYARAVINLASPTPIVIINGSRNVTVRAGHSLEPCLMLMGRNLSLDCAGPRAGQVHDFLAGARFRRAWWGPDMVRFLAKTVDDAPTRL